MQIKRVFIVGCPRSGTTWATFLLGQHPEIAIFQHSKLISYLHALKAWWVMKDDKWGKSVIDFEGGDEDSAPVKFRSMLKEDQLYELCRQFAGTVFDEVSRSKPGATIVVDKTPENLDFAEFILKTFPDAYFLHVIRDPRSAFRSMQSAGRSWARFEFPTKPVDGAEYWRKKVEEASKIRGATPNYEEVRYEDLTTDGAAHLERLFAWLGVPRDREFCEKAVEACTIEKFKGNEQMPKGFFRQGSADSWRRELSDWEVRVIEHMAAEPMQRLGYEAAHPPFRRTPLRIRLRQYGDRLTRKLEWKAVRMARRFGRRRVGRLLDYPEHKIY